MPKKLSKQARAVEDFHFIVIISVFAALTIFAANYLAHTKQAAIQARQRQPVTIAPLDIVAPTPKSSAKPYVKVKPLPTTIPIKK